MFADVGPGWQSHVHATHRALAKTIFCSRARSLAQQVSWKPGGGRWGRGKVDDRGGPSAPCPCGGEAGLRKTTSRVNHRQRCYRSDWSIGRASSTKSAANSEKSAGGATLTVIPLPIIYGARCRQTSVP